MGYSFENQKYKIQSNIFKISTSFLNFKLQILRLALELYANSLTQFVDRKVVGLVPKYKVLPAC